MCRNIKCKNGRGEPVCGCMFMVKISCWNYGFATTVIFHFIFIYMYVALILLLIDFFGLQPTVHREFIKSSNYISFHPTVCWNKEWATIALNISVSYLTIIRLINWYMFSIDTWSSLPYHRTPLVAEAR